MLVVVWRVVLVQVFIVWLAGRPQGFAPTGYRLWCAEIVGHGVSIEIGRVKILTTKRSVKSTEHRSENGATTGYEAHPPSALGDGGCASGEYGCGGV